MNKLVLKVDHIPFNAGCLDSPAKRSEFFKNHTVKTDEAKQAPATTVLKLKNLL